LSLLHSYVQLWRIVTLSCSKLTIIFKRWGLSNWNAFLIFSIGYWIWKRYLPVFWYHYFLLKIQQDCGWLGWVCIKCNNWHVPSIKYLKKLGKCFIDYLSQSSGEAELCLEHVWGILWVFYCDILADCISDNFDSINENLAHMTRSIWRQLEASECNCCTEILHSEQYH